MAKGKVESEKSGNWGELGGNNAMHSFSGTGKQTPGHSSQEGAARQRGSSKPYHAEGGNNKAFVSAGAHNTDFAGLSAPGVSSSTKVGSDEKFASGGKTHMWGNRGSRKAVPGQSGPNG